VDAMQEGPAHGMTHAPRFPDEAELVARCLRDDREAFGTLVERYAEPILNAAYRMVGDRMEAEDLAQETFLSAWKALPGFRAEARFSTWLYRIAMNKCKDALRARRQPDEIPDGDGGVLDIADLAVDGATPERELIQKEMALHLEEALQTLPLIYREAFVLKHIEGLSYEEMSAIVGVAGDTLKMRVYKARVELRRKLAKVMGRTP
jgi:RNA polymerase sigma-70 factor (ECF subfamily)